MPSVASPEEYKKLYSTGEVTSGAVSVFSPYSWVDSGFSFMRQFTEAGGISTRFFREGGHGSARDAHPWNLDIISPCACVPGSSCSVSSLPVVVRLVQQWIQHMRQFPEASDDPDFHVTVHG